MKFVSRTGGSWRFIVAAALSTSATLAGTPKEAEVTQIIREVKLLPSQADPRDAVVKDKVSEDTGVRTGEESRSELTFADLTITRLGANTVFSFSKAGRTANVDSGSILLRVPKNSGGGSIKNAVVTVAITGTTVIFEAGPDGVSRLITLEGNSKLAFTNNPGVFRRVRAGQMLEIPAGATTLPMPVYIDLRELMRTHPLIVDFRPLPSQPLIMAVAQQQPPPRTLKQPPPAAPRGPVTGPGTGGPGPAGPGPVGPGISPSSTPKSYPSPTARPVRSTPTPTPSATVPPKPSPSATTRPSRTATPYPTPSATVPAKPSPTPRPKPTPKPTSKPTASPKVSPTRRPVTKPSPTATPPPIITRTNSNQTYTPTPKATPHVQRVIKRPTPPPVR